jgi:hypothetical protein
MAKLKKASKLLLDEEESLKKQISMGYKYVSIKESAYKRDKERFEAIVSDSKYTSLTPHIRQSNGIIIIARKWDVMGD